MTAPAKKRLLTGRILSGLVVLFLTFDGVTKVIREAHVVAASAQMGIPMNTIVWIGIVLLVCTALYVIPQTSVLGAVLLTGYLGGAVATQVLVHQPLFEMLFPLIFGILVWAGMLLREERLVALLPFRTKV